MIQSRYFPNHYKNINQSDAGDQVKVHLKITLIVCEITKGDIKYCEVAENLEYLRVSEITGNDPYATEYRV